MLSSVAKKPTKAPILVLGLTPKTPNASAVCIVVPSQVI
jgi:hypothetical protein